ncbi:TRAP transporter large permease subunit, partial [Bacillus cereus]|uniref:TRAP transporter large permease subunit n=1 Tax=Bacillus cereus TaxID=1396 RepID=UPI002112AD4E|nr:TRAP transporter large permease subunit [Bacillus cereus]
IYSLRHGYKGQRRSPDDPSALRVILDAIPSLLLIVIVVGGIVTGIFTATEGAGIAVAYCLLLALIYRGITWRSARMIMERTISTTGVILFL